MIDETPMTPAELRELDARIEREIFKRCPHPVTAHKRFRNDDQKKGIVGAIMIECGECDAFISYDDDPRDRRHYNIYTCSAYHASWDAVMGKIVPEMERRGWRILFARFADNDSQIMTQVKFGGDHPDTEWIEDVDPKIAVIRAALAAISSEGDKQ